MNRLAHAAAATMIGITLAACGGGGGSSNAGSDASTAAVLAALESTNVASTGYPWTVPAFGGAPGFTHAPGLLKRWTLPIPVKTNGESRAIAAMDEIERQLGTTLFDRTSIANVADNLITRGVIVSVGTTPAYPGTPEQFRCAATVFGYPPASSAGVMSLPITIHIDGPVCRAVQNRVTHEFGHSMGMGQHYSGFEEGDAVAEISALFWRVLRTIYANPPGTPRASIVVPG